MTSTTSTPLPKWCYTPQYLPIVPQFSGGLYELVNALHVEQAPRYAPKVADGHLVTWCNILAWDIASALGHTLPHWVDKDGAPCQVARGSELTANATMDWLATVGIDRYGWHLVSSLQDAASSRFAVAVSKGAAHGHIAVVRPDGFITQAGARCYSKCSLEEGFGRSSGKVRYFAIGNKHEHGKR